MSKKNQNNSIIRVGLDGDKWCALVGDNLQEGFAAFGDSKEEAIRSLVNDYPQFKSLVVVEVERFD